MERFNGDIDNHIDTKDPFYDVEDDKDESLPKENEEDLDEGLLEDDEDDEDDLDEDVFDDQDNF